ncbi:MAG: non-ribosomal peptide synthetase, partial [Chloroflexi bacterium]
PLMPNGKVDRRTLALKTPSKGLERKTVVAPRTPLEKALAAIWMDLLHIEQVSITDNFFDLGGHSLLTVQLLTRINQQFGSGQLSLTTLFHAPTIEQVAALLRKEMSIEEFDTQAPNISPCVLIQHVGEKSPFFCVHPISGAISCYSALASHLPHDRPFYGIQTPGLSIDQVLFGSIEEMASSYIDEVLTIQPQGPYLLGGYSFGGLVAFEMARQLQAQEHAIALLAILDTYPSQQDCAVEVKTNLLSTVQEDSTQRMMEIAEAMVHTRKKEVLFPYEELRRLQPEEQLAYVLEQLIEARVVPEDMDISQLLRYRPVYEMHDICLRKYRPKPYSGRITLFHCEEREAADPSLWAPFSSEPVEVYSVSGDHQSMIVEPYVQSLAAQLQRCLDKADGLVDHLAISLQKGEV